MNFFIHSVPPVANHYDLSSPFPPDGMKNFVERDVSSFFEKWFPLIPILVSTSKIALMKKETVSTRQKICFL